MEIIETSRFKYILGYFWERRLKYIKKRSQKIKKIIIIFKISNNLKYEKNTTINIIVICPNLFL